MQGLLKEKKKKSVLDNI